MLFLGFLVLLGVLSGITGGEVFFHPRFTPTRDGCKVLAELRRVLTRETAVSVTMRIRCSNGKRIFSLFYHFDISVIDGNIYFIGIRIAEHFGSFLQRNVTDLDFGNMDADKAIAAIVKHEGKLDEKYEAHFQCALLYTSANGERRVRCHNLALSVTSAMGNVFRSADMDATIAVVTKQCWFRFLSFLFKKLTLNLMTFFSNRCGTSHSNPIKRC